MFRAFAIMRQLHELLWYLAEAATLAAAEPFRADLERAHAATERLTDLGPDALVLVDVAAHRERVNGVLLRGARARAPTSERSPTIAAPISSARICAVRTSAARASEARVSSAPICAAPTSGRPT